MDVFINIFLIQQKCISSNVKGKPDSLYMKKTYTAPYKLLLMLYMRQDKTMPRIWKYNLAFFLCGRHKNKRTCATERPPN